MQKPTLLVKESLNSLFDVIYSSIYKTPAEGFEGEDFLNSVCKFDTDKNPQELRTLLKNIEKDMGRTFTQKGMSNRVIDLDLILYGDLQINRNGLELPSSDIEKYKFVLEPLAEIAPRLHTSSFEKILQGFIGKFFPIHLHIFISISRLSTLNSFSQSSSPLRDRFFIFL